MPNDELKTLEELWDEFLRMVVPKNAPDAQLRETKIAFYAGATAAISQFERVGMPDISEDDAFDHMDTWKNSCIAFQKECMRRYTEGN